MLQVADTVIEELLDTEHPVVMKYKNGETIAVVNVDGVVGVGVAKCNPIDHYNKEIGTHIALARAVKMVITKYEQTWVERAKTKQEVATQRARKRKEPV